ncbi:PREDICTED: cytochrome c oxidase assembly factor 5 [Polistes canadensis]|uniref:cytochrome c oxidase assembly factor 5 n=1 Tax=Polistes canadensis TaxID=91411 RepID=UPI000718B605|nr:PREDICTED: cytochrome c oxidase assembly factor 5 [Polistes canadensis]
MDYPEHAEVLKDTSRCAHLRAKLKLCLLETDCCKKEKITPRECLQSRHPSVPDECYAFWHTLFDCKHSMVDGRRRFRGIKGS